MVASSALFGGVLATHQPSRADTPAAEETDEPDQKMDLADQLREIKSQVKEINTLLHSGTLRVIVVVNPPAPDADAK